MSGEEKVNVLLVDDDPVDLLALEASLESLDQRLVRAGSGAEALRFLLQNDAAVIVVDVQLMGMDGFELARLLKQRRKTRHIPLIFLTAAYQEDRFMSQGYALGAVDYLAKPIEPEVLRQKVSVFVDLALKEAALAAQLEEVAAQKRLVDEIVANAPAGIAYLDSQQVFRSANAIILKLLGGPSGSVLGKSAAEVISDEALLGAIRRVLASGTPYRAPEPLMGPNSPGEPPSAHEVSLHPVWSPADTLKGLLIFLLDVSDRVANERLQLEQIETLRNVDKLKDQFLSIVSHELRTPLNAILGFGSLLEDEVAGPLSSQQMEYVRQISKGGDKLLALVDELLDLSRIRAGKLELELDRADFAEVVRDVVVSLEGLAKDRGLTLQVSSPGPLLVCCDAHRMSQVLTNLVGNALKFTPHGGTIEVEAAVREDDLVVQVKDSGIGIASEDLPKLFARFTQLDMTSTRRVGGTGLGLSIAKELVEAHGGTIGAMSEGPGKGSTFWFSLPLKQAGQAPTAKTEAARAR